ncbi:hypothetical protein [Streptococcus saliviloxodontae]|uniref:Uncharacterized protein n=1 Tax=Streptococcus saliviloxodontae TaxID=1349416 RepID=A0ABS2PJU5_9STRE|nr:hypothetical protein [Streptococcus saliviloxodontae]MBM7635704.1 hypothetical protein [Streptococcus saliviloxodontae]
MIKKEKLRYALLLFLVLTVVDLVSYLGFNLFGKNLGVFTINSFDYLRTLGIACCLTFVEVFKGKGCFVFGVIYGLFNILMKWLKPYGIEIGLAPYLIWTVFLAVGVLLLYQPWKSIGARKRTSRKRK